jgi:hypothetical protein
MLKPPPNPQSQTKEDQSNRIYLYYAVIFVLGASLCSTMSYGMANFEKGQSISAHIIESLEYRMALSIEITLQVAVWMLYAYAKSDDDPDIASAVFVSLTALLISWIGLTIFLSGPIHSLFAGIAICNIVITTVLLSLITDERTPKYILWANLVPFLACVAAMMTLSGSAKFYIPEYLAFIFYSAFFTIFFLAHPYYKWRSYTNCYEKVPQQSKVGP